MPERGVRREEMRTPEDVLEMRRLHGLGLGTRRIAVQFGCSRTKVRYGCGGGAGGSRRDVGSAGFWWAGRSGFVTV